MVRNGSPTRVASHTGGKKLRRWAWWGGLLPLLLLFGGLRDAGGQGLAGRAPEAASAAAESEDSPGETVGATVSLTIDYGDGFQKRYPGVPWRPDMTVGDLLRAAQRHPRGISLKVRGRGKMSLLVQIDDLKNQGGRGLNWVYRVNKRLSDRSLEVHSLEKGDTVLWKFDKYR